MGTVLKWPFIALAILSFSYFLYHLALVFNLFQSWRKLPDDSVEDIHKTENPHTKEKNNPGFN